MNKLSNNELRVVPLNRIVNIGEIVGVSLELHTIAKLPETADLLRTRELRSVIARYAKDQDTAQKKLIDGRNAHIKRSMGMFALIGNSGHALGLARIDPAPNLRRQILSLPPRLVHRPFAKRLEVTGPQVSAWTAHREGDDASNLLRLAYAELGDRNGVAKQFYDIFAEQAPQSDTEPQAWTIEPTSSPYWVRSAISKAGYSSTETRPKFYDDGNNPATPVVYGHVLLAAV